MNQSSMPANHVNSPAVDGPRQSRRLFVSTLSMMAGISLGTPFSNWPSVCADEPTSTGNAGRPSSLLVQPRQLSQLETRSKIVLEVSGQLRIKEDDPTSTKGATAKTESAKVDKSKAAEAIEVKGKSTLDYFEKIAFSKDSSSATSEANSAADNWRPIAAARRYVEAGAEHWVSGTTSKLQLRPDCSETRLMSHAGLWQQYCEHNPLDAREVQLLQSPINSAAVELLLPIEPARADSQWTITAEDARRVFNLDAVHNSQLHAKITKVEKGVATVSLKGKLEATANSVPTHLAIDGNFQVKTGSQGVMVTWLGLAIQEERQVSQSEPGFDITARVRMIREEAKTDVALSADELRKLAASDDAGRWLVKLQSTSGRYSMLADRRWHIHRDSAEEAILRMVENNTIIAQCSVSRLSELEAGQQLTIEGLQADIKGLLGEGFGQFVESSEKVVGNKLRAIRTVVSGELEEVPIQWIYTHLSDDNGRRLAMIYTMGGNVTDRFGAADEQMVGSFDWLADPPATEDAKPAKEPKMTAERSLPKAKPKR